MPEPMQLQLDAEPERYELREPPRYRFELDRRLFLGAAAGLLISTRRSAAQSGSDEPDDLVSARLHIARDGSVTVFTSKVEVGQGSRAQITQAAAEELRLPVERVTLVMGDTARTPDDGSTAGSRTTPSTVPDVRRAAAAARQILLELAREQWQVDAASLETRDGQVVDEASGRSIDYGELAAADSDALRQAVPENVVVTPVNFWKVLGTGIPSPNGRDIVTGAHQYPSDIRRPGMLFGRILRPPAYGAVLTEIDLAATKGMPGVAVVRDGEFVGCAAPTSFAAGQAIEALAKTAKWKRSSHPSSDELFSHLKKTATTDQSNRRRFRSRSRGDFESALAQAVRSHQAAYEVAYIQHAPMEPRAAAAEWQGDQLTVWTGTQRPSGVQEQLAETLRMPLDKVRVIVPDTGGGFGGKHTGETAIEAARLAKAAGRPVSLQWTREEEFTWAYFRPAGLIEARAGLSADGRLTAWEFINYNSGGSALETPYEVANAVEQFRACDSPLREGSYRALASTANTFARESFMDELAAAAGQDPLDFRLANLEHERLRAVLEAAAEKFGWRERHGSNKAGRGVGLACGTEKGSYVAACVEVSADPSNGSYRIEEICQAFECGAIQNPDNLRAQNEGSIVMTLGATVREEIRFKNGEILNPRFSEYPVPRFEDVPKIETVLVNRPDLPSVGAGETPMIAVPAATANALFDACGVRVRSMPIRGEALRRA